MFSEKPFQRLAKKQKKKIFFRFSEICNFREEKLVSEFLLTGFGIFVKGNPFLSFSPRDSPHEFLLPSFSSRDQPPSPFCVQDTPLRSLRADSVLNCLGRERSWTNPTNPMPSSLRSGAPRRLDRERVSVMRDPRANRNVRRAFRAWSLSFNQISKNRKPNGKRNLTRHRHRARGFVAPQPA